MSNSKLTATIKFQEGVPRLLASKEKIDDTVYYLRYDSLHHYDIYQFLIVDSLKVDSACDHSPLMW